MNSKNSTYKIRTDEETKQQLYIMIRKLTAYRGKDGIHDLLREECGVEIVSLEIFLQALTKYKGQVESLKTLIGLDKNKKGKKLFEELLEGMEHDCSLIERRLNTYRRFYRMLVSDWEVLKNEDLEKRAQKKVVVLNKDGAGRKKKAA